MSRRLVRQRTDPGQSEGLVLKEPMQKHSTNPRTSSSKLTLRTELVRVLTRRDLELVVAGACLNASVDTQTAKAFECSNSC
jgi:hypothetical protein